MTDPHLPPLDDDRIAAMESRIVAEHRRERSGRRRRHVVGVVGATVGVLALAAVVGPIVGGGIPQSTSYTSAGSSAMDAPVEQLPGQVIPGTEESEAIPESGAAGDAAASAAGVAAQGREIVTTASATVQVDSVTDSLAAVSATAEELGGYVESSNTSATGPATPFVDADSPLPVMSDSAFISIRIPADRLTDAQDSFETLGTVTESSTNRQDITTQAVDLRARISAAQTSVDRLTALLAQAGSVADLLTAESALAERQGELESLTQQLTAIESQVSLSSLTVLLTPAAEVTTAEPAGFLDGLIAGWNGLIASANGLLIGLGFLLPWLVVAGFATLLVVSIRRARRRRIPR
ncbi:MAG: DUF4349 domain-containing protein [Naasia sp.]